ncbi:MAG: hypothetical protein AAFV53_30085 [Myxococcota bacterium]
MALADRLPRRYRDGRRSIPASVEQRFDALVAKKTDTWALLDWLHVIRHKGGWDVEHRDAADRTADDIWQESKRDAQLRAQLIGQLVQGMCGGVGLPASMLAAFNRIRPLEESEPLLQDIVSALLQVHLDPDLIVTLCMAHNRSPRALMRRVGLPDDLDVLDRVEKAIPEIMKRKAKDPKTALPAVQWLLASLREDEVHTQDLIVRGLLDGLTVEEAKALPDLCFWLNQVYGPKSPKSRFGRMPAAVQKTLLAWLT